MSFIFWDSSKDKIGISEGYLKLLRKLEKVHGKITDSRGVQAGRYVSQYTDYAVFTFDDDARVVIWKSTIDEGKILYNNGSRYIMDFATPFTSWWKPITWRRSDIDPLYSSVESMYPEVFGKPNTVGKPNTIGEPNSKPELLASSAAHGSWKITAIDTKDHGVYIDITLLPYKPRYTIGRLFVMPDGKGVLKTFGNESVMMEIDDPSQFEIEIIKYADAYVRPYVEATMQAAVVGKWKETLSKLK